LSASGQSERDDDEFEDIATALDRDRNH
jgi:hypothetical protein